MLKLPLKYNFDNENDDIYEYMDEYRNNFKYNNFTPNYAHSY